MHVTPVCKYYFDFDLVFHNHFISATAFGWGGGGVHGFNFPNERLCPSTLMQMFHKSEIVLVEQKIKLRRALLRSGVNDILKKKNRV